MVQKSVSDYRESVRFRRIKHAAVAVFVLFCVFEVVQLTTEKTFFTSSIAQALFQNNLHEVRSKKLYRSAEMSPEDLQAAIAEHGIRSVIDLRAGEPEPFTDGRYERDLSEAAGASYFQVPLIGSRMPERGEIKKMLEVFEVAAVPVLLHCSSGTHRTGVAAAVWLLVKGEATPEEASKQLANRFGFFRFERRIKSFLKNKPTIDNFIWDYLRAYDERGVDFSTWVQEHYQPRIKER